MACCFFGGGLRFASVPDLLFCLVGGRPVVTVLPGSFRFCPFWSGDVLTFSPSRDVCTLLVQNRPPDFCLTACFEGFRPYREGVFVRRWRFGMLIFVTFVWFSLLLGWMYLLFFLVAGVRFCFFCFT